MESISGLGSSMRFASEALNVHSVGMQVAAHNVANVSTGDFEPQRATYATGSGGVGVALESVRKMPSNMEIHGSASAEMRSLWGGEQPSGTEIAREMPNMMLTQHGYEANAKVVTAVDEMFGSLMDIKA